VVLHLDLLDPAAVAASVLVLLGLGVQEEHQDSRAAVVVQFQLVEQDHLASFREQVLLFQGDV
jgi:hypothetical protein